MDGSVDVSQVEQTGQDVRRTNGLVEREFGEFTNSGSRLPPNMADNLGKGAVDRQAFIGIDAERHGADDPAVDFGGECGVMNIGQQIVRRPIASPTVSAVEEVSSRLPSPLILHDRERNVLENSTNLHTSRVGDFSFRRQLGKATFLQARFKLGSEHSYPPRFSCVRPRSPPATVKQNQRTLSRRPVPSEEWLSMAKLCP